MANKTLLVAQREYLENVRTKMFWIGILAIPVMIVGAMAVSIWLSKKKDVRTYAVVDKSDWLLAEIDKRAAMPDLETVFSTSLDWLREKDPRYDALPISLQSVVEGIEKGASQVDSLTEAQKEQLRKEVGGDKTPEEILISGFAQSMRMASGPEGLGLLSLPGIPDDILRQALDTWGRLRTEIWEWWSQLPPEEADQFGKETNKSRYVRHDVEGTGDAAIEALNKKVADKDIFAYFIIGEDPVDTDADCKYVSNNLTDGELKGWFGKIATDIVREKRMEEEAIDPETAERIQRPVSFVSKKVSTDGKEETVDIKDKIRQFAPVAFVYVLWLAIFSIAQMLLTNTIEEKSNRILEVLLSSISPIQLMMGKIFGICMTGLTVVTMWILYFVLAVRIVPKLMGVDIDVLNNLSSIAGDPLYIGSFLIYFILGYLFFAAFLVGIGSVCNSIKEANNLMMPVTFLLMMPLLSMIPISQDPNGSLARFLSFVPPFTPFVMMNRAAGPPEIWEYVVTTILLIASIIAAMWGAAKIFRIGILMTGKPPTPIEMWKWLRAPIGQVPTKEE